MPYTTEQLDNWFTDRPPTEEQVEKYREIGYAASNCVSHAQTIYTLLQKGVLFFEMRPQQFDGVTTTFRAFAEIIDKHAPDSADKTAAIRCVRLARNAVNEMIVNAVGGEDPRLLLNIARQNIIQARWQANAAIACGGK